MAILRSRAQTAFDSTEPEPEDTMTTPKEVYKIDLVSVDKFTGEKPVGLLDAGAGGWWNWLGISIQLTEMANATTWPQNIKKAVAGSHLAGRAARRFVPNYTTISPMDFEQLGDALRAEFACKLSLIEVGAELMNTTM